MEKVILGEGNLFGDLLMGEGDLSSDLIIGECDLFGDLDPLLPAVSWK